MRCMSASGPCWCSGWVWRCGSCMGLRLIASSNWELCRTMTGRSGIGQWVRGLSAQHYGMRLLWMRHHIGDTHGLRNTAVSFPICKLSMYTL